MDWKTYSERKRTDLKAFLQNCPTKESALERFSKKGIETFPETEVDAIYNPVSETPDTTTPLLNEVAVDTVDTAAQVSTKDKSGSGTTKS